MELECTQQLDCEPPPWHQIAFLHVSGSTYPIKIGPNQIGRDPSKCQIILDMENNQSTISRLHAVINVLSADEFMIMDLNSANKTKCGGKTLSPYLPMPLKNGDLVQFGNVCGIFRLCNDDDYLPMTQALDGPETMEPEGGIPDTLDRFMQKHVKQIIVPESPECSDVEESFTMPSLHVLDHKHKQNSKIMAVAATKFSVNNKEIKNESLFWKASSRSSSIILDDSSSSLNNSKSGNQTQRLVTNSNSENEQKENSVSNIHEMDTQVQQPLILSFSREDCSQQSSRLINSDTKNIHFQETQLPNGSPKGFDMHNMDTQVPVVFPSVIEEEKQVTLNNYEFILPKVGEINILETQLTQSQKLGNINEMDTQIPEELQNVAENEQDDDDVGKQKQLKDIHFMKTQLPYSPKSNRKIQIPDGAQTNLQGMFEDTDMMQIHKKSNEQETRLSIKGTVCTTDTQGESQMKNLTEEQPNEMANNIDVSTEKNFEAQTHVIAVNSMIPTNHERKSNKDTTKKTEQVKDLSESDEEILFEEFDIGGFNIPDSQPLLDNNTEVGETSPELPLAKSIKLITSVKSKNYTDNQTRDNNDSHCSTDCEDLFDLPTQKIVCNFTNDDEITDCEEEEMRNNPRENKTTTVVADMNMTDICSKFNEVDKPIMPETKTVIFSENQTSNQQVVSGPNVSNKENFNTKKEQKEFVQNDNISSAPTQVIVETSVDVTDLPTQVLVTDTQDICDALTQVIPEANYDISDVLTQIIVTQDGIISPFKIPPNVSLKRTKLSVARNIISPDSSNVTSQPIAENTKVILKGSSTPINEKLVSGTNVSNKDKFNTTEVQKRLIQNDDSSDTPNQIIVETSTDETVLPTQVLVNETEDISDALTQVIPEANNDICDVPPNIVVTHDRIISPFKMPGNYSLKTISLSSRNVTSHLIADSNHLNDPSIPGGKNIEETSANESPNKQGIEIVLEQLYKSPNKTYYANTQDIMADLLNEDIVPSSQEDYQVGERFPHINKHLLPVKKSGLPSDDEDTNTNRNGDYIKDKEFSDCERTPKKNAIVLPDSLPDSQEIKLLTQTRVKTLSTPTDMSDSEQTEENSESQGTPIVFRKKSRKVKKNNAKLDLMARLEAENLPTRILTRIRKPSAKLQANEKLSNFVVKSNWVEEEVDEEIIMNNIAKLKESRIKGKAAQKDAGEIKSVLKHLDSGEKNESVIKIEKPSIRIRAKINKNTSDIVDKKCEESRPHAKDLLVQDLIENEENVNVKSKCERLLKKTRIKKVINEKNTYEESNSNKRTLTRHKKKCDEDAVPEIDLISSESESELPFKKRGRPKRAKIDSSKEQYKEVEETSDQSVRRSSRQKTDNSQSATTKKSCESIITAEKSVRPSRAVKTNKDSITKNAPNHSRVYSLIEKSDLSSNESSSPVLGRFSRQRNSKKRPAEELVIFPKRPKSTISLESTDSPARSPLRRACNKQKKVLFTAYIEDSNYENILEKLGAKLVTDAESCSVVVTSNIKRTFNLLCAIGLGKPIVGPAWLEACRTTNVFVDPGLYLLKDEAAEKRFKFSLVRTLAGPRRFLAGYSVSSTPSVVPEPDKMKLIVECSGGKWKEGGKSWLCVSTPKDEGHWGRMKEQGATIVSLELILSGVLRQQLDVRAYKLA